jgi:RimJ/RimL family protein N-acetyltransferase
MVTISDLGPTLETPRLILRPPIRADLEGWAAMMADEQAARFVGGVQARSSCWRAVMMMAGSWALEGFGMFSVLEKSSGAWIGRAGPWRPEGWPGDEVGYGFLRSHWGHGFAVEAAAASIDWAVDHLGWIDVIHCIDEQNIGSQAVARRLGARMRGMGKMPAPFENDTTQIWGQSAAEWRQNRNNLQR